MDLIKMAPHLATFVDSFITITAFWIAQSRILNLMPGVSTNILWRYRAYFICLILVSIAAVWLSSNPFAKLPLIIYTSLLLVTAIFHVSLLYAALRVKPVEQEYSISCLTISLKKIALAGPACYLMAIAACFINIYFSFLGIITAMFFYLFFMRKHKSGY